MSRDIDSAYYKRLGDEYKRLMEIAADGSPQEVADNLLDIRNAARHYLSDRLENANKMKVMFECKEIAAGVK